MPSIGVVLKWETKIHIHKIIILSILIFTFWTAQEKIKNCVVANIGLNFFMDEIFTRYFNFHAERMYSSGNDHYIIFGIYLYKMEMTKGKQTTSRFDDNEISIVNTGWEISQVRLLSALTCECLVDTDSRNTSCITCSVSS